MKIDKEISKKINENSRSGLKTSYFQNMLDQHLREARGESLSTFAKKLPDFKQPYTGEFNDLISNISRLKEMDAGYFEKANKKKTLAENFSSRFGVNAEERIQKFKPLIEAKAEKYGLDPNLFAALVKQESNFNPYAVSHCGAMGLGQLMPETARHLGVTDPFNAAQNLEGAAKYLREMLDKFGGNTDKALAAYNAGPGAVAKYGGIPPYRETQHYVRAINSHRQYITNGEYFAAAEKSSEEV